MWWMYGGFDYRVPTVAPPARHGATGAAGLTSSPWAVVMLRSVAGLGMLVSLADWRPRWLLGWLLLVFVLWLAGLVAIGAGTNRFIAAAQARARYPCRGAACGSRWPGCRAAAKLACSRRRPPASIDTAVIVRPLPSRPGFAPGAGDGAAPA